MKSEIEVKAEIKSLGNLWLFMVSKELRALPKILHKNEKILGLMSGFDGPTSTLVCLTNQRILFIDKNFWYGANYRNIPLKRLTSTEGHQRWFFADLTFYEGTRANKVTYIGKKTFRKFIKTMDEAVFKSHNIEIFIKEIEKLGQLMEKGLLTKAEFECKKKELLNDPDDLSGEIF